MQDQQVKTTYEHFQKLLTPAELAAVVELVNHAIKWQTGGKISNFSPMFDLDVYPQQLESKCMLNAKHCGPSTYGHTEYSLSSYAYIIHSYLAQ
jgi:hypothetical protein